MGRVDAETLSALSEAVRRAEPHFLAAPPKTNCAPAPIRQNGAR